MKKWFLFLVSVVVGVGLSVSAWGQTPIFTESMGTVASTTTIAAHETVNGFDNDGYTMTGTADLRTSTASSGYTGASGVANVFITNTIDKDFQIEGINTVGYSSLTLSLGHYKSTTASNNELVIEVSSDGTNYTQLTYSRPTGSGTATWMLITPTGTIPATSNLRIRFRQTSSVPQFRIDDIKLTGTAATYTVLYNGNGSTGGSVPTDASSPYSSGSTVTVLGNTGSLLRTGYTFNNWNTASNGSGTSYSGGGTFTITANTTLYAQWTAASTPIITVSPTTLTGFTYIEDAGPSGELTFTVSGTNLTNDISISASTNYEISKTSGSGYASPLTFTQSGGTVNETTVYVRLKSGLSAGDYNSENITAISSGATTKTVACNGTVTTLTLTSDDVSNCGATVWFQYSVVGSTDLWTCGSGYWAINGFGDENDEDYLISSSSFNFDSYNSEEFTFKTQEAYNGNNITLWYSSNYAGSGNPTVATWTQITHPFNDASSSASYSSWYNNTVDLSSLSGSSVYLAFKYTCTSATAEAWRVDDLEITGILAAACSAPAAQPTVLDLNDNTTHNSIVGSFTASAGTPAAHGYLVVRSTASSLSGNPVDGTTYTAGESLGGGTVVSSGSSTNFTATGLSSSTQYYFFVFAYQNTTCSGGPVYLTSTPLSGNETTAAPTTITLNSSNPAISIGNIIADSDVDNTVIYAFNLSVSTFDAVLTEFAFTTSGTYAASNITNFKAWYSSDATFNSGSDTYLANLTTSLGLGAHTFTGFSQTIASGSTGYIFITADLPCGATNGNTIQVSAITTANLTFNAGNKTGTAYNGGTKTITSATPNNVTALSTANCENGGVDLSWTAAAGCSNNVIVVASPTALTTAPSGNGISYNDNAAYGSGTAYDGGYVVYKGTGTSVSISGLTNGTNYTYTVFTRNDLNWSSGVAVNCTPDLIYCDPGTWISSDSEIESVILTGENNSINNVTTNICTNTIQDKKAMSADLNQGDSYTLTVEFGDCNGGTQYAGAGGVWIDWNSDGDFYDINEEIGTVDVAVNLGNVTENFTINVPVGQTLGNYIMRIVQDEGGSESSITPCASPGYGTIVDYTIEVISPCTPTHTVSSYTPTSGPVGTEVIVNGTGFTGSTSAVVNGASATIVSQTATKLIVKIPSGASTGNIVITESACNVNSGTFTVIEGSGSCTSSSNFTDIIISEVYDADANNVINVELYNPTASAIDLTNYTLEFYFNGSSSSGRSVNITGTISPSDTYLAQLGTSSNTCNSVTYDFNQSGSGINGDDDIRLYNGSTEVDEWIGQIGQTGFSVSRKGTAVGPKTTYAAADWDISLAESCSNLGVAPVSSVPPPTISVLSDYNSCELDLSVTASAGDGGTLTYQWYYTDNVSPGWTAVTSSSPAGLTIAGETSNNLMIVSDASSTSIIDDYQFYVEVTEDGACSKVSNAARYTVGGETYFRSKGTGNWSDLSSWEMSTSTLGPWIDACIVPNDVNSDYVSVENGHTISVVDGIGAPDLTINQLTVQVGGIFIIKESAELEISNGAVGADVVVLGTLRDEASSGAGNGIEFLTSATWELGANGTIIKTYNSSVIDYRDNYETGISNIPATSNWAFVYTGQGAVSTIAVDMFYPNLHFESTSGVWNGASFAEVLTGGSGGFATVKGDLNVGVGSITGGIGNCIIYNNNINSTPMLVQGDIYIENGSVLTNDSYDGTTNATRGDGTGLEVKGGLYIDGRLDNTHGTGKIILSGTSQQDIVSSNSGEFKTYDLVLNNINNVELDGLNIEIENSLTFTNGKIITNVLSSDIVFVKNPSTAAIIGGNTSGTSKFVQGKLQRSVNTGLTYVFPIGHSTQNAQGFTITPTGANGSNILGYLETNNTNPTVAYAYCDLETHPGGGLVNSGDGDAGYDGILDKITFDLESPLQWDVTNPGGGITSYDITTHANGGQDIAPVTSANGTAIRYLLKNGEPGNSGVATGNALPIFSEVGFFACPNGYSLTGMTGFSDFTINGATKNNSILPVELISFTAKCNNSAVELIWATASEINNDYFEVQKSDEGNLWYYIGTVKGAGNSNIVNNYSFTDKENSANAYYRLRQVDFDGKFEYSPIIVGNCIGVEQTEVIVYPNPVSDIVNISIANWKSEKIHWEIVNITGQTILSGEIYPENSFAFEQINMSELKPGMYLVRFMDDDNLIIRKADKK